MPPFTCSVWPVTYPASRDARYTTAAPDVFTGSKVASRNLRQKRGFLRLRQYVGHRRSNKAGCHAIHGNVATGKLLRQRLGHADQPRLGRGIIRLPGIAGLPDHRRDRDHAAEALLHHRLRGGPDEAKGGFQVHADHLIPFLILHPHREIVTRDTGIVDENVDPPAQRLDGRRHQTIDRCRIGQVRRHRDVVRAKLITKRSKLLRIRAGERQARALRRQRLRNRRSDSARCAGDQRGHPRKVKHHSHSFKASSTTLRCHPSRRH